MTTHQLSLWLCHPEYSELKQTLSKGENFGIKIVNHWKIIPMKKCILLIPSAILFFAFTAQDPINKEHLIQPKELAEKITNPSSAKPVILNVGAVDQIKTAIKAGPADDPAGFEKFKAEVSKISKDKEVVIYCGCCTSQNCPNIRPAIKYLTDSGYKKAKVLDIPTGIKEDWVQKGYPVEK
jgi:thiosulfate/3-mercaptopyruvate sulfurtransferase